MSRTFKFQDEMKRIPALSEFRVVLGELKNTQQQNLEDRSK
jgi:hypothetical protein